MGETNGAVVSYLPAVTNAACSVCSAERETISYVQEPLLRHGGYGEAQAFEFAVCRCGVRLAAVRAVKPVRV